MRGLFQIDKICLVQFSYQNHIIVDASFYKCYILSLTIIYMLLQTWKLREEERLLEIVDPELTAYSEAEVMRFIKVALFCTQGAAQQRPTMKQVVEMLSKEVHLNENALLEPPKSRERASRKFGGPSSSGTSSSHSGKRKQSSANPDITSTHSLIYDDTESQMLPR